MVVNCLELIFYCSFHYHERRTFTDLQKWLEGKEKRTWKSQKVIISGSLCLSVKQKKKRRKKNREQTNKNCTTTMTNWQLHTGLSKIMGLYLSSSSCNFLFPPPISSHQPPHDATATTVVTNYLPGFSPFLLPPPPPDSHHLPRIRSWIRLQEQMDPHPPPAAPIQSWPLEKLLCIPFVW